MEGNDLDFALANFGEHKPAKYLIGFSDLERTVLLGKEGCSLPPTFFVFISSERNKC